MSVNVPQLTDVSSYFCFCRFCFLFLLPEKDIKINDTDRDI